MLSCMKLIAIFFCFLIVHGLVWFSTNLQLIKGFDPNKAFLWCIALAIPTSISAYLVTKISYDYFESAWSVRLVGHGMSYLVFPALTWILLNESPFQTKTMLCIVLSLMIICIQIFYPN